MMDDERCNMCEFCGADLGCTGQAHFKDCQMHPENRKKRQFTVKTVDQMTDKLYWGLANKYPVRVEQTQDGFFIEYIAQRK
jgi:hypothetical protein